MIRGPVPLYRSSGQRGYSSHSAAIRAACSCAQTRARDPGGASPAPPATVPTPEGLVHARPGDAIRDRHRGELGAFRVSIFGKYRPLPPTLAGEPGRYESAEYHLGACRWRPNSRFCWPTGYRACSGQAGDWLVDYGDGSLGIVSRRHLSDHLRNTASADGMAAASAIQRAAAAGVRLRLPPAPPAPRRPRRRDRSSRRPRPAHRDSTPRAIHSDTATAAASGRSTCLSAIAVLVRGTAARSRLGLEPHTRCTLRWGSGRSRRSPSSVP